MTDQIWLFVGEGVLTVEIVLAVVGIIVWERNPRGWFGAAKDSALRTPVKAQKVPSQIALLRQTSVVRSCCNNWRTGKIARK